MLVTCEDGESHRKPMPCFPAWWGVRACRLTSACLGWDGCVVWLMDTVRGWETTE
jgi:hypothetical protein